MAGKKINDLTALGRDLASTDLLELSLAGGTGSRKITGQQIINAIPSGITIGTTAITSGTVGRVLFQGTGNVVSQSANLFWDNTNGRLGIGTSSPSEKFEIVSGAIQLSNAQPIRSRYTGGAALTILQMFSDNNTYLDGGNDILFRVLAGATTAMRLKNTGNVLINTTTDAGYKLDVNGTARVATKVVTPILEGVSSGRVDLKYGFGTSTPSTNILSVGYGGEPAILIGSGTTQNSSMIQMNSTTQGFLPPRMSTTQVNAISLPAEGLVVYNTTISHLCVYQAGAWVKMNHSPM